MVSNNTLLSISLVGTIIIAALVYSALSDDSNTSLDNISTRGISNIESPVFLPPTATSKDEAILELQEKITALQQQLSKESQLRKTLADKLAKLEDTVASRKVSDPASESRNKDSEQEDSDRSSRQISGFTGSDDQWFNEQALVTAGIDSGRIGYIKNLFEQTEMEKLYLRNQAIRENWINTNRYQKAAKEIADKVKSLRTELTEQEYDAYLYASGHSNRVVVSSVLGGSPAESAGIKTGDTIIKYGGEKIYNWTDLTTATSNGDPNNTVAITILRDGQQQVVYMPQGPLGVKLSAESMQP